MDRILLAPEPLIRAVLVALCDNERLHARSLRYLDRLEKLHPGPEAPTSSHPQPTGSRLLGKRKAPEPPPPQICIQCKHAFLPDSNNPQACAFHHGSLNIDPTHRTWAPTGAGAGAGQASSQRQDTDENREDRPDGFLWSCCARGGAGPGCTEGEHLAVRADDRSKRPRLDPDELRMFEGKVLRPNEFVNDNLLDDDDSSSSDDELVWGGPVSRGVAGLAVEEEAVAGDGDVRSEATERDSGGGSE